VPFSLSITGATTVSSDAPTPGRDVHSAERLASALRASGATDIAIDGSTLTFSVKFFRAASDWNFLVPFDRGQMSMRLSGDVLTVHYDLSVRRLLLLAMAGAAFVAFFPLAFEMARGSVPLQQGVTFFLAGWAWLFGGNYVIAMIRVPRYIRRNAVTTKGSSVA